MTHWYILYVNVHCIIRVKETLNENSDMILFTMFECLYCCVVLWIQAFYGSVIMWSSKTSRNTLILIFRYSQLWYSLYFVFYCLRLNKMTISLEPNALFLYGFQRNIALKLGQTGHAKKVQIFPTNFDSKYTSFDNSPISFSSNSIYFIKFEHPIPEIWSIYWHEYKLQCGQF